MQKVVTPGQMRAIDSYMINKQGIPGIVLMENAAMHITLNIMQDFSTEDPVLVVCGVGNNGGDGLAAARQLLGFGYDVHVAIIGNPENMTDDCEVNFRFFKNNPEIYTLIENRRQADKFFEKYYYATVIIDALFGTGLSRNVEGLYKNIIEHMNTAYAKVISADIPSGVDAGTGRILGTAVKAYKTVTFQYPKIGHFIYPGAGNTGELSVYAIGVDDGCPIVEDLNISVCEYDDHDLFIEKRNRNTNKGTYGEAAIIGGSYGMAGAVVLASKAVLKTGAGKTRVLSCGFVSEVIQNNVPEAMCAKIGEKYEFIDSCGIEDTLKATETATALIIGPGIGKNRQTAEVVKAVISLDKAKIIDADALNLISENEELFEMLKGEVIVTPHPKEMSRLTGISVEEILANPIKAAAELAIKKKITVLLKGASTVVADASGNIAIVPQGSAGMAKGGSGDVLSGVIGSFIAQGYEIFDAAVVGAYVCGLAGELAEKEKGEYSMTPEDTINHIGEAIKTILHEHDEHCHH